MKKKQKFSLMLSSIVFVFFAAFFIRAHNLDFFPLGHDEFNWNVAGFYNFDYFLNIPVSAFKGYIMPIFPLFLGLFHNIVSSFEMLRIFSVLVGVLTVVLIFFLAKKLYNEKVGIIASVLLCFLPWHIVQSRTIVEVIFVPFFSCLIFIIFLEAAKNKNNKLFLLSWSLLLLLSFYLYHNAVAMFIVFVLVLFFIRGSLKWVNKKTKITSIILLFMILFPLIFMQMAGNINYTGHFYNISTEQSKLSSFNHGYFVVLFNNLINNSMQAFQRFFIKSDQGLLFSPSLKIPLFINLTVFFVLIFSCIRSFVRNNLSDRIVLIWFFSASFAGLCFPSFFEPRFVMAALIPAVIIVANGLLFLMDFKFKKANRTGYAVNIVGFVLFIFYISIMGFQLKTYYSKVFSDKDEFRRKSYGCKQAAKYLSQKEDIENVQIVEDSRMTARAYLKYLYGVETNSSVNYKKEYYLVWSSGDGLMPVGEKTALFKRITQDSKEYIKEKTICYPWADSAIYIYRKP